MPSVAVRRLRSSDDICIDDAQPDDNSASTRKLLMNLIPLPFFAHLEDRAVTEWDRGALAPCQGVLLTGVQDL
jgi:hypothetical protein